MQSGGFQRQQVTLQKTCASVGEVQQIEDDKKKTLFDLIDTYIRDAKTKKPWIRVALLFII